MSADKDFELPLADRVTGKNKKDQQESIPKKVVDSNAEIQFNEFILKKNK